MSTLTGFSPVAVSYAQALMDLAVAQNQPDAVGAELRDIAAIIKENPAFAVFLANPAIGHLERTAVLQRVFKDKLSPLAWSFLGVMNNKGRLPMLEQISGAYAAMLAKRNGLVDVRVTSAQALSEADLDDVRQKIGAALGKTATVHPQVDESIIGGLVIEVDDKLIDASVRYQLHAMKEKLMAARPR